MAQTAFGGIGKVAVIGCGLVGASWAALFLAHGLDVAATDPAPGAEERLRRFVGRAMEQLAELSFAGAGRLTFHAATADALDGAGFVQENAPEDEALKRALLAEIDALVPPPTIVASSTSALLRSRIIAGCAHPGRHVVGHPFNPPHLIPLVEIVGDAEAAERAAHFYRALGRRPVLLRHEIQGHI